MRNGQIVFMYIFSNEIFEMEIPLTDNSFMISSLYRIGDEW